MRLPNAWLGDEVGALPCSYPLDAMRSGSILLKNKLGIIMSTKYATVDNPMEEEVQYSKNVLDGIVEDTAIFSLLYEPDNPEGDWTTDENILSQANPLAIEVPVLWGNLIKTRNKAIELPSTKSNFLTKHCNIICSDTGSEAYVDIQDVKACTTSEPIDWNGRDVYVGIDLSVSGDNTAVSVVARDNNGKLICRPMCFIPKDRKDLKSRKERCNYDRYIEENQCIACGSDVIDYGTIEDYIINLPKTLGVNIIAVGYDRYNALSSVCKLEEAGIPCIEVKQHSSVLTSPTKLLYEEITTHNFMYEENELFEVNFNNCKVQYDTNLNRYVHKKKSQRKVDMVVATLDAVCLLEQSELLDSNWVCE